MALAGTQQLHPQGPVPVHRAHCTEGITRSEGREEANGDGVGTGAPAMGGWTQDGNGDENRHGEGYYAVHY